MGDKKKRTRSINALDIVIILVIVIALSSVIIRAVDLRNSDISASRSSSAEVEFIIRGVRNDLEYDINDGDTVRLLAGDVYLGKIDGAVYSVPSERADGVESELYRDILGVMSVEGNVTSVGYFIKNALYVSPGNRFTVCTENAEFTIEILNIQEN